MMEQRKFDIDRLLKHGTRHRAIELPVEEMKVDAEARTVELSISSEYMGLRRDWWEDYYEVILHGPDNIILDRLNNKASVLFNHKADQLLGVVEKAWLDESAKKVRALLRFSETPEGDLRWKQIQEGVLSKVSIGYDYYGVNRIEDLNEIPVVQLTKTEIFEVSMVTIPFDDSVGVGRSKQAPIEMANEAVESRRSLESLEGDTKIIFRKDEKMLTEEEKRQLTAEAQASGQAAEIKRCNELVALREAHEFDIRKAITEKRTVEEVQSEILTNMQRNAGKPASNIGMTEKEAQRFSIVNAIRAMVDPTSRAAQEAAAFEREASDAVVQRMKPVQKRQGSFHLPWEVQKRASTITTGGLGAGLVPTVHRPDAFIDFLRDELLLNKLGITYLSGLVGSLEIPKQSAGSSVGWIGEGGTVPQTDATFINVPFGPKYVAGYIEVSRGQIQNSLPSIEQMIMADLAAAAAEAVNLAVVEGTGEDNQPTGLLNLDGVQTVTAANFDFSRALEMQSKLSTAKVGNKEAAYLITSALYYAMQAKLKTAGVAGYLLENDKLAGKPAAEALGIDGDHIIYGAFKNVVQGEWGGVEIWANPYVSASANIQTWIYYSTNIMNRRPTAFVVAKNASLL